MIRRFGASTSPRSSTKRISQKWGSYRGWVSLHNDQGLSSEDQIPVSAMPSPSSSGTSGTDWRLYRLETQRRNRPGWLRFPSLTCRNPQTPRDAAHRVATGKGWGKAVAIEQAPHAINSAKAPATNGIYYHGGPARDGEPFLHLRRLVRQLCDGLGGKFYSQ